MKRCLAVLLAALAAMIPVIPPAAKAVSVQLGMGIQIHSVNDFNAPLAPLGSWLTIRTYGRVWRPSNVIVGWRPYSVGSWVWTDAGWFWQSDEPWAWATYHYGSWFYDTSWGWVWIPATDWAPAWVSWRYSSAYIGWAPIGPSMTVMAPSFFMFVGVNRFRGSRFRPGDLIINNITIINKTKEVRNFERETVKVDGEEKTIYSNKGPGVGPVEEATGETVKPLPVQEVARETPPPKIPPGNENQQAQQPETKPGEQPGNEATLPPTGKEHPETQPQQPGQTQPETPTTTHPGEQPAVTLPGTLPSTGGEQQNNYQHPETRPAQPGNENQQRPETKPSEQTPSHPPGEQPSVTTPPSTEQNAPPQTTPQQTLPPTGRPSGQQPPETRPATPSQTPGEQPSVTTPPSTEQNAPSQRPNRLPPTGRPGSQQPSESAPATPPSQRPSVTTPPSTEQYNESQEPNRPQQQLPPTSRPGSQRPNQRPPVTTPPSTERYNEAQEPNQPQQQLPPTGRPSRQPPQNAPPVRPAQVGRGRMRNRPRR